MGGIFISYRREDSAGHAGRILDALSEHFGPGQVFMDVDAIEPGQNFARTIEGKVSSCDVLIAIIGKQWSTAADVLGHRRLDSPEDYLRREIEWALQEEIPVIPVLIGMASMPGADTLPNCLRELSQLQAYVISDQRFHRDLEPLLDALDRGIARGKEGRRVRRIEEKKLAASVLKQRGRKRQYAVLIQRMLLFYIPRYPATWILHILFYVVLTVTILVPPVLFFTGDIKDMGITALTIVGVYVAFLLLIRGVVFIVEPDRSTSPLRRWFLLYKPPRTSTALLHLLFVLSAALILCWSIALPIVVWTNDNGLYSMVMVQSYFFVLILTLALREIAANRDPLKALSRNRSRFAEILYTWRPRRSIAWIPRIVFYTSASVFVLLGPQILADSNGTLRWRNLVQNRNEIAIDALYLAIALAARGWAAAWQMRRSMPTRLNSIEAGRRMLLLCKPSRRDGWAAYFTFYAGLLLAVWILIDRRATLVLLGIPDASPLYIFILAGVLTISAHFWASGYARSADEPNQKVAVAGAA